jgi:hypothetical protein
MPASTAPNGAKTTPPKTPKAAKAAPAKTGTTKAAKATPTKAASAKTTPAKSTPAKSTPAKSTPPKSTAKAAAGNPDAVEVASAQAEKPTEALPDAEVAETEVPMNRAERRAKGRGKSLAQLPGQGKVSGGHGPVHTQRNWANRRSG